MLEPVVEHGGGGDAADPVDPVGAPPAASQQVPGRTLQHQSQRADGVLGRPVRDAELPGLPDAAGDVEQERHRLPRPEPVVRLDQQPIADRAGGRLGPAVHGGEQRPLRDAGVDAQVVGDAGHRGEQHPTGVGVGEVRHAADAIAGLQADPAAAAGLGVERHARGGQGVDVAVDGADRHLQRVGQLPRRGPPPQLEDQQQLDEAAGSHGPSLRAKP
jgi:hypothetical protein